MERQKTQTNAAGDKQKQKEERRLRRWSKSAMRKWVVVVTV